MRSRATAGQRRAARDLGVRAHHDVEVAADYLKPMRLQLSRYGLLEGTIRGDRPRLPDSRLEYAALNPFVEQEPAAARGLSIPARPDPEDFLADAAGHGRRAHEVRTALRPIRRNNWPLYRRDLKPLPDNYEELTWTDDDRERWAYRIGRTRIMHRALQEGTLQIVPATLGLLLAPGGEGSVLLKTYLLIHWLCQHRLAARVDYAPASQLAAALGLPDPDRSGARRTRNALGQLKELRLVELMVQRPRPPAVSLLQPDRSGASFDRTSDIHVELPHDFFTRGWIAALSGPALAALLLVSEAGPEGGPGYWKEAGISNASWQRGLAELRHHRLIASGRDDGARSAPPLFRHQHHRLIRPQLFQYATQRRADEWHS